MNSTLMSFLFDKKLIEMGSWPEDELREIEKWNETADSEKHKIEAARLVSFITLKILGKDCDSKGRIRIRRLGSVLSDLEKILVLTRSLERKFYRDHLNHSIRVALLARAIGSRSPFNLSRKDLDKLVLACIFHDIAYPLSQVHKMIGSTLNALKNCYNIARTIQFVQDLSLDLDEDMMCKILPAQKNLIKEKIKEFDHGLLSAFEFISYLKLTNGFSQEYSDIVKSIALHSPLFNFEIDSISEKMLTILIIADELQDWGRPITRGFSPISKIDSFRLDDNVIHGTYTTQDCRIYSVLRQIYGKSRSLSRLRLPLSYDLQISFSFENFRKIILLKFEKILQSLFEICTKYEKKLFDHSNFLELYRSDSPAEEIYYGMNIPEKYKKNIYELLLKKELSQGSPYINFNIFVNNYAQEIIFTPNRINEIESLRFLSEEGSVKLRLQSSTDELYGNLHSVKDAEVLNLGLRLAAEIRFFNICIQKLSKFRDSDYPVHIGIEGFPEVNEIKKILADFNIEYLKLFHLLPDIVLSIANDGFFIFR